MNYLIQNFSSSYVLIGATPRSRVMRLAWNWDKINFLNKILKFDEFSSFLFYKFNAYFYSKQLYFFLTKFNFDFISFYENNLFKSAIYWNLKNIHKYGSVAQSPCLNLFFFKKSFLPVKAANAILVNVFYKNFFYYLLSFTTNMWNSYYLKYKNYLNFVTINHNFLMIPYYNGYFFNIYHF